MKIKKIILSMLTIFTFISITGCSSSTTEIVEGKIEKHYGTGNSRYNYVVISHDGYYDNDGSRIAWDMKDGTKVKLIKTTYKNAGGGIKGIRLQISTYGGI